MKQLFTFFLLIAFTGCGGSLSDEQRKELRKEEELHELKRVTDDEIMFKALETGREIRELLLSGKDLQQLEKKYKVTIQEYTTASPAMDKKVRSLWEAYKESEELPDAASADNIQRDYPEHLLYTYPLVRKDTLYAMQVIVLSKKEMILAL